MASFNSWNLSGAYADLSKMMMKLIRYAARTAGQSVLAAIVVSLSGISAHARWTSVYRFPIHSQVPISVNNWLELQNNPEELGRVLSRPPPVVSQGPAAGSVASGPWQSLTNPLSNCSSGNAANPLLLNDGTVLVHIDSTSQWCKLKPDINGSYLNGTWSAIASMPSTYGPRFFGSQVLPSGRVAVEGGEYNFFTPVWMKLGAVYNPLSNTWTKVNPPAQWTLIGDAPTIVLNNGTYMQADCCDTAPPLTAALGDPPNSVWFGTTGSGKFDVYDEEGWTLLPNGKVLTVDAYVLQGSSCAPSSEIYSSSTGAWTSAGSTIKQLSDCKGTFPSFEMGPQVLRPDGTVVAFGATTNGRAHTAIYTSNTGTWTAGPDLPVLSGVPYILADAPAAVEPSGNVLFAASPGNWTVPEQFPAPTHFWETQLELQHLYPGRG
jgi:hypothetical protein